LATHPEAEVSTPQVKSFFRFGASPRAAQTLALAGKVKALLAGRQSVSVEDVQSSILPALRHRCILNFEAEAEGITTDDILTNLVDTLPTTIS
jgi:MoxR-like ATPase